MSKPQAVRRFSETSLIYQRHRREIVQAMQAEAAAQTEVGSVVSPAQPDAADPTFLRGFARSFYGRGMLTRPEMYQALASAGITAQSTIDKLRRDLHDPKAAGAEGYDVGDVAAWFRVRRDATRAASAARKASGAPIRSTKAIKDALQWARHADDGRLPTVAHLLHDLQVTRMHYDDARKERYGKGRTRAARYLEKIRSLEDILVSRHEALRS